MYNFFRNRKTKSRTTCIRKPSIIQAIEFFKYTVKLFLWNCFSTIFKSDLNIML